MADYNVSQLEDTDGNLAKILAKRLESAIQIALSGDVSGTSAATVLDGDVAITLTIGAKKVKNTHIDDDAVRAEHVKDGENLPVDITGNAATATKATKDSDGNIIKNTYLKIDDAAGNSGYIPKSQKGAANGVATLDGDGKVPSSQLPSYVDDTLEGYLYNGNFYSDSSHTILIAAETGKIYVDKSTNRCYRWSGSQYTEISASLALGETSSTAYRGDRGKTAYDHSQRTGNPHNTSLSDLGVTATASELNVLDGVVVNVTEINRLDGVTGNIQQQLDAKALPSDIASAIATEVSNRNSAIATAIQALDSNKTSTDGTNVQVKVTLTDGKVTAVNIMTDNTASAGALNSEISARTQADTELGNRATALESGKEDKSNKVTAWQSTPDNTHYPSEKLVKDTIDAIESGSSQQIDEHKLDHDNPHAVNKVQLSIPNLGNCIYDSNTHTLKMLDMSFTAKGMPVETDDPQIGDALYVDGSGNKHYLKGGDMLKGTTIPSGYLPVGVVIQRRSDDVLVHYYNCNETKRFASAWMWEITGMTLDGASHSIVFRQRKNETENVNIGTFTYTASTLADFCTALDTWLRSHPGGTAAGAGWNYDWHCEYMENYLGNMACIVIADVMSDYRQANSIVASGATATMNYAYALPAINDSTGFERVGGSHGIRAGANANRLIEYYTSNPGTTATLTSDVTPTTANVVVSKTQFESDSHCAPLRAVYKTYAEYIKKCVMLKWPALTYGMKTVFGKQKEWTYALSGKTHKKKDGTTYTTFPAASYAGSIAFNSPGLEAGCWRMMGIEDTFEMISKMNAGLAGHTTYAGYDIVNKTLNAMGGAIVSLGDPRWLAVRLYISNAWIFSSAGIFYSSPFYPNLRVSAVALLTL